MSTTLTKGLRLLEALCVAREPLGITELSRSIDMNLSAVQRLLSTLVKLGYAEQIPTSKKYRATLTTWETGAQILSGHVLRRALHPILRHAAHSTHYTAYFILNNAPFVTYFDKVEGSNGLTYSTELGASVPIAATAAGMAIVAFLTPEQGARLATPAVRSNIEFKGLDLSSLADRIAEVRQRRYATSESGFRKGVNSVAAPIWGRNGEVCGSIALTADENELKVEKFPAVGLEVVRWAEEATLALGGIPYPQAFYK